MSKHTVNQNTRKITTVYTANIYSGNWDTRKKCKSYKYLLFWSKRFFPKGILKLTDL